MRWYVDFMSDCTNDLAEAKTLTVLLLSIVTIFKHIRIEETMTFPSSFTIAKNRFGIKLLLHLSDILEMATGRSSELHSYTPSFERCFC